MEKILNFNEQFFTIFAPPRSGSTWLYSFLAYYLEKHGKFDTFSDGYFNKSHYFEIEKKTNRWSTHSTYKKGRFYFFYKLDNNGHLKTYRQYSQQDKKMRDLSRLQLLQNTISQVLLKLHPDQLDQEVVDFLVQYPHVFLERKDTWGQLLSFLLANHTKSYIINKGQTEIDVRQQSIRVDLMHVRRFCSMLSAYEKLKTKESIVITYEEIFKDPLIVLTRKLGLPIKRSDIVEFKNETDHPIKQRYGDKERYFSNIEQIRKVYERYRKPPKHL